MKSINQVFILLLVVLVVLSPISLSDNISLNKESKSIINSIILQEYIIIDGERMFSLRELAEYYDWSLIYCSKTKDIIIINNYNIIKLRVNANEFNGQKINKAAEIIDGRTYIGLEQINLITEALLENEEPELITYLKTGEEGKKAGESLNICFGIYNISNREIELKYNSGQLYELYLKKDNKVVWKWSDGKFFTMAFMEHNLKPGEGLEYEVEMTLPGDLLPGEYKLCSELSTINKLKIADIIIEIK
jgi:hypothetical protein